MVSIDYEPRRAEQNISLVIFFRKIKIIRELRLKAGVVFLLGSIGFNQHLPEKTSLNTYF